MRKIKWTFDTWTNEYPARMVRRIIISARGAKRDRTYTADEFIAYLCQMRDEALAEGVPQKPE